MSEQHQLIISDEPVTDATTTNSWSAFYENRVNNKSYLEYFEKKYFPLFSVVKDLKPYTICEEGIGIGSVSAILAPQFPLIDCFGFDNDPEMLKLCRKNAPHAIVWEDCILHPRTVKHSDLVITHGVLEHFEDHDIQEVFRRYRQMGQRSIHYVPTDKYEMPSFGDERLLSPLHWLKLTKPRDYILFNDDKDLLLIN